MPHDIASKVDNGLLPSGLKTVKLQRVHLAANVDAKPPGSVLLGWVGGDAH